MARKANSMMVVVEAHKVTAVRPLVEEEAMAEAAAEAAAVQVLVAAMVLPEALELMAAVVLGPAMVRGQVYGRVAQEAACISVGHTAN